MKTNFRISASILALLGLLSCVQDDDFDVPSTAPQEVSIEGDIVEIAAVRGARQQQTFSNFDDETIVTFDDESDLISTFMSGYVVSSDEGGNFFEEIILQDKPENPTVGIKLLIDVNPLFTSYQFGQHLFIRLDGLSVGVSNGVLALGTDTGIRLGPISAGLQDEVITRTQEIPEIIPLEAGIDSILEEDNILQNPFTNLFVRLSDIQFVDAVVDNPDDPNDAAEATTYASEPNDQFDGERLLEECFNNSPSSNNLTFSTSTFADFKARILPNGNGTIDGIISSDFNVDKIIISVNSPEDVVLDGERCAQ